MNASVEIGETVAFELRNAILVYSSGNRAFATVHGVEHTGETGPPHLGPGRPLGTAFLKALAEGMGRKSRIEILPPNVLARNSGMVAWWTPAKCRTMFFAPHTEAHEGLNGKVFPHPALVFKVEGKNLFVRALAENARPEAGTRLMTAPYWNTDERGLVCQGSMRVPRETSLDTLSGWESAYFESEFTHPNGAVRLTIHPDNVLGLWKQLAGSRDPFPATYLTSAEQTLLQFVDGKN